MVEPEIEPRVSSSWLGVLQLHHYFRLLIISSWVSLPYYSQGEFLDYFYSLLSFLRCIMKGLNQWLDVSESVVHGSSASELWWGRRDVLIKNYISRVPPRLVESKP